MSYYGAKGDFYSGRTGYYRGDPGFFSSLGSIIKNVGGGLVKSYTGVDLFGGGGANASPGTQSMGFASPLQQPTYTAAGSASRLSQARGRRPMSGAAATAASRPGMGRVSSVTGRLGGGMAPTMGGGGGFGRRRHRMNVTNPRALRRAIRRTHGFAKLAMKTIHLVHPKKRATFGGFRKKRRR
jgi:hypothetical protein